MVGIFKNKITTRIEVEKKCEFVQFVIVYELLKHECPIMKYKSMKKLFDFLQVPNIP
jgi:hypothetical protein